jgi:prevent-host-death family protein
VKEIDRFVPITEAKTYLFELVRNVQANDEVVVITRGGLPAAVIMSASRWESLLEMLDILSDEKGMASLRQSIQQARGGEWVEDERVFNTLP